MDDFVRDDIIQIIERYEENNPSICVEDNVSRYPVLAQEVLEYLEVNNIPIQVDDINIARVGMPVINGGPCFPMINITLVGKI